MLAEVLLVLAGHPSAFFVPHPAPPSRQTSLRTSPSLAEYLHPGEISSLNALGNLAFAYTAIRTWCREVISSTQQGILLANRKGKGREQDRPVTGDVYLSTLAHGILAVLAEYEQTIVDLEARVLRMDEGVLQDHKGFVPLSVIVAPFSSWTAPLQSLLTLVHEMESAPGGIEPGRLLDILSRRTDTGHPDLARMYAKLLAAVQKLWTRHLTTFVLYGQAFTSSSKLAPAVALDVGPDPLSPRHRVYELNEGMLPPTLGARTRESLLYVGRVVATLKREGRGLPGSVLETLQEAFGHLVRGDAADCGEDDGAEGDGRGAGSWYRFGLEGLDEAVALARKEVGEWLWRYVLTGSQIIDALDSFANFLLTRRADHALSLIHELDKLVTDKLILSKPTSSSSVIRDADLHHAWLRASVGTSAEHDRSLDTFRLKLDDGPFRTIPAGRPSIPRSSTGTNAPSSSADTSALFSSIVLGAPISLHPTISWPLDLFLTPPACESYIEIHSFLFALRTTHQRCLKCWKTLTSRGVARDRSHRHRNTSQRELEKTVWSTLKLVLFFLEELLSHYMIDIIDVQHRALLEQLDPNSEEGMKRSGSVPASLRGSTRADARTERRGTRAGSPASTYAPETVRSRVPPTPNKTTAHLEFLSLRQLHARHLAFLKQGLLITDKELAVVLRDIMEACTRFTGLVERWNGMVLPHKDDEDEAAEHEELLERQQRVYALKEEIFELLLDFFKALVESQKPPSSAGDASGPSGSFTRTARAAQIVQSSRVMSRHASFTGKSMAAAAGTANRNRAEQSDKGMEVESMMGRHIEQLLLRLDYNGVFTSWLTHEKAVDTTQVLAQGGL